VPTLTTASRHIELDAGALLPSRTALAVFHQHGRVYKILDANAAAAKLKLDWRAACARHGLPTPIRRVYRASYAAGSDPIGHGAPAQQAMVIEMTPVALGLRFHFSVEGPARLAGWIAAEQRTEVLARIRQALVAARAAGLQDPRGVLLADAQQPLQFLDVRSGPRAHPALTILIDAIASRGRGPLALAG